MKNVNIEPNYILVFLDVVSLFTNVPIELASDSVIKRWDFISRKTKISLDEFLIAFRIVLNSFFLIFNSTLYKQIFGTPMGSPLSVVIDIMQDLEEIAIGRLPYRLLLYFRYVNNIILTAPSKSVDDILRIFNSLNIRLQFTVKVGRR